jgi:hypothetical protein
MDTLDHLYELQYISDKQLYRIQDWIKKKEEKINAGDQFTFGERRHYDTLLYLREMYQIHNEWLEKTIAEAKKLNGITKYVLRPYKDIEPRDDDYLLERVSIGNPFRRLLHVF